MVVFQHTFFDQVVLEIVPRSGHWACRCRLSGVVLLCLSRRAERSAWSVVGGREVSAVVSE